MGERMLHPKNYHKFQLLHANRFPVFDFPSTADSHEFSHLQLNTLVTFNPLKKE